jgi:hypothetical protein
MEQRGSLNRKKKKTLAIRSCWRWVSSFTMSLLAAKAKKEILEYVTHRTKK